ncbi:MAG: response regulator [Acidobacteria bacterium]|nr:response regulator [Acidobacteriota bacterium]
MSEHSAAPARGPSTSEAELLRQRVEELEAQLAQSQKLLAIGSLAGGVAHDFNNLLTAILGYASLLREDASVGPQVLEALDVIEKAAERASQLTGQLLGFVRRGGPRRVRVDVHQTLGEVAELLRHTIDKSIRIETRFDAGASHVPGDPSQIYQVFLNLALNARDAMPDGGTLTLATTPAAGMVRVSVMDTGAGIPLHIRDRIFEPFFTTKDPGKGTGMGLTVVQSIVRSHGGRIEMECESGTRFHVDLPLSAAQASVCAEEAEAGATRGKGSVLVIDDEEVVRQVAARMLNNLGYHPICLGSSREAIDYYSRRSRDIDMVIVDLVMPELSGQSVFERLREINPRVRVVLTSGYSQDAGVEAMMDRGAKAFLPKPYRLAQLSETLAAVMKA